MSRVASDVSDRVIATAMGLFAEFGYQGCSLLRIAKAAGTSESGVLRFFASKEDVFLAVIDSALAQLHRRIDTAFEAARAPAEDDDVERLMVLLQVVFDMFEDEPEKVALIFSEGGLSLRMLKGAQGQTLMTLPGMLRLVERVSALFVLGCKRGTFKGIDPVAAREAYFGIIEGTILGWLLSSGSSGHYTSASAKKMLNVTRKMLTGLTLA
jgi:AcrR family transcriptional regulator